MPTPVWEVAGDGWNEVVCGDRQVHRDKATDHGDDQRDRRDGAPRLQTACNDLVEVEHG